MSLGFVFSSVKPDYNSNVMEEAGFTCRTEQRVPDVSWTLVIIRTSLSFEGQELYEDSFAQTCN